MAWALGGLVAVAGLLAAADSAEEQAAKKEMEKLAGTWTVTTVESNGRKAAAEDIKDLRYVFKADGTWKLQKGSDALAEGTFKLDPSKKLRAIDYAITSSVNDRDKGKTSLGVYELAGDTMKVCRTWPGEGERPDEFAAGTDSKRILTEFTRDKP
jgi:uncharacterized protein (TIGR03067 family)